MGGFSCDKCRKQFASQKEAEQHFNSVEHLGHLPSRVQNSCSSSAQPASSRTNQTALAPPLDYIISEQPNAYFCTICKVPCTGIAPIMQHVESTKHKKNIERVQLMSKLQSMGSSSNASPVSHGTSTLSVTQGTRDGHTTYQAGSQSLGYMDSTPPIDLSSMGASHLAIGGLDMSMLDYSPSSNQYTCKCCLMSMSGEIPASQHLEGAVHNRKKRAFDILQNQKSHTLDEGEVENKQESPESRQNVNIPCMTPKVNLSFKDDDEDDEDNPLACFEDLPIEDKMRCKVCDILVTGHEPALQHARGKNHKKALKANSMARMFSKLSTNESHDTSARSPQTTGEKVNNSEFSSKGNIASQHDDYNKFSINESEKSLKSKQESLGSIANRFDVKVRKDDSCRTVPHKNVWKDPDPSSLRSQESETNSNRYRPRPIAPPQNRSQTKPVPGLPNQFHNASTKAYTTTEPSKLSSNPASQNHFSKGHNMASEQTEKSLDHDQESLGSARYHFNIKKENSSLPAVLQSNFENNNHGPLRSHGPNSGPETFGAVAIPAPPAMNDLSGGLAKVDPQLVAYIQDKFKGYVDPGLLQQIVGEVLRFQYLTAQEKINKD